MPTSMGHRGDPKVQFHDQAIPSSDSVSCNLCGKRYTRVDHLARHFRSHTQEKPFECQECGKAFGRADLLKRHASVHEDGTNKRQKPTPDTRRRVARACIACAKSKLRCDGAEVCERCRSKGLDCVYRSSRAPNELTSLSSSNSPPQQQHEDLLADQHVGYQPTDLVAVQQHSSDHVIDPQLPSTAVFANENVASVEASESNIDYDDLYLADFLRDIIDPAHTNGDQALHEKEDVSFAPRDFLDFNIDPSLAFFDNFDHTQSYAGLDHSSRMLQPVETSSGPERQTQHVGRSGYATPVGTNGLDLGAQAFKESLWLWTPKQGDHAKADRINLSIPVETLLSGEKAELGETPFPPIGQRARDQILAAVLDTCDSAVASIVISCFPSCELLTVLVHRWIVHQSDQVDSWFHVPRFDPNTEQTEMLMSMVAAGAALSSNPQIRKLGYAFQEAARALMQIVVESDNRNIRRLTFLQTLTLVLDVGLWSGDKRKVEIAESIVQCLVTMTRRGGYFAKEIKERTLSLDDNDPLALQHSWISWIESESLRRLVAHLIIRDCQTSMSLLIPPLISFAEVTCEMPSPLPLWKAKSAEEWASLMRMYERQKQTVSPSIRSCLSSLSSVTASSHVIDLDLAILTISSAFWGLCWQHRQIEAIARFGHEDSQRSSGPLSDAMKQTAIQKLDHFKLEASEWKSFRPEATLTCERQLMNLHVSLEDVQLLAGKAGQEEARKVYSSLKSWAQSSGSRQAIWHAGQIVRAAKQYPPRTLREASAVAVYHAGLVFWAYTILATHEKGARDSHPATQVIALDDEAVPQLERFILLGRGTPILQNHGQSVPLSNARKVMSIIIEMLQFNNGRNADDCPPLVDNLNRLMRSLGNAARCIHVS